MRLLLVMGSPFIRRAHARVRRSEAAIAADVPTSAVRGIHAQHTTGAARTIPWRGDVLVQQADPEAVVPRSRWCMTSRLPVSRLILAGWHGESFVR